MLYLLFGIGLAVVFPKMAQASDADIKQQALAHICEPKHISGNSCLRINPNLGGPPPMTSKDSCDIQLNEVITGHFISPTEITSLIQYTSKCEPHVNSWGGSILLHKSEEDRTYRFSGFERGMTFTECITPTSDDQKNRLFCETAFMGQGIVESTISQVIFTKDYSGNVSAHLDVLLTASEDVGGREGEEFDCTETMPTDFLEFYSYELPKETNLMSNLIPIKARYLDANAVQEHCNRYKNSPETYYKETPTFPLDEGHILIRDKLEGEFVLNLLSRKIVPADKIEKGSHEAETACNSVGQEKLDSGITSSMREGMADRIECVSDVINARIDVIFEKQPEKAEQLKESIQTIKKQYGQVMWSVYNENDACVGHCGTINHVLWARLTKAIEIIDNVKKKNEKALLFIETIDMQSLMADIIKVRYGLRCRPGIINGKTGVDKIQKLVDNFQEDQSFDVMILSPKVGGVGLTLTAANHVIHLSRWWNPAVEDQSTDRAYRLGQKKEVHVYYPMAIHPDTHIRDHSFDLKLNALLEKKRQLSRDMLIPSEDPTDTESLFEETVGFSTNASKTSIEEIDRMEPEEFERWILHAALRKGYIADGTKGSWDNGSDGIIKHKQTNQKFILQAKHSCRDTIQDEKAIEDLLRAREYYDVEAVMVALTNRHFSKPVTRRMHQLGIRLIDRDTVCHWPQL